VLERSTGVTIAAVFELVSADARDTVDANLGRFGATVASSTVVVESALLEGFAGFARRAAIVAASGHHSASRHPAASGSHPPHTAAGSAGHHSASGHHPASGSAGHHAASRSVSAIAVIG